MIETVVPQKTFGFFIRRLTRSSVIFMISFEFISEFSLICSNILVTGMFEFGFSFILFLALIMDDLIVFNFVFRGGETPPELSMGLMLLKETPPELEISSLPGAVLSEIIFTLFSELFM